MAIKTKWDVKEGGLTLQVMEGEDRAKGEEFKPTGREHTIEIDLNEMGYAGLNEVAQAALEFGVFTRLRNATAGKTFSEAIESIDAVLAAWAKGEWGAERVSSATPFGAGALLVRAILRAAGGAYTLDQILAAVNGKAEATSAANFTGAAFASLEDKDRAKVRKAVIDSYAVKQPKVARAMVELEREAAEARAAKKLASLGDAEGDVSI